MKIEDPATDKIREYEATVELAVRAREPLGRQTIQKIEELIRDLDSHDDPVFQVNCLQLVADLACSRQALSLLESKRVPEKLISLLDQGDPLIVPHALKFFYRIDPQDLKTKYRRVLDKICDYCQSDSQQLLDYAVDIIAAIGRGGLNARRVLDSHPNFRTKCLSRLGSTIVSSDSLIKTRTLRCIVDLLELHEDDPREESSKLSEDFYHAIIEGERKMTNQILALCRVPFMEIRISAMLVVAAIADQIWGQRELVEHPNFLKWILDRSTEACKDGKEAKFEILKILVKSKTTTRFVKGEDYMKLRADFKNGPFHVGIAEEMLLDDQQAS